jgi:hypothetical protein
MTERHKIVLSCLLGSLIVLGAAAYLKPKDPACVKLEARLGLAEVFCQGLAEKAATDRCSSLAEDPEVMGQCLRVIVPAAHSGCMDYINIERIKRQHEELCS